MAKNRIKTPGELQVDDTFYMVVSTAVDEHKGNLSKGEFRCFDIQKHVVDGVKRDTRDNSLRIIESEGEEYRAPKNGYNGRYDEKSVIADEQKAKELYTKLNHAEWLKVKTQLEELEEVKQFMENVIKIHDPELSCLKKSTVLLVEENDNND